MAAGVVLADLFVEILPAHFQPFQAGFTGGPVHHFIPALRRNIQLDQVQQRVRVPGEHAGAGGPVHAALLALAALAVVVAVDHGAVQFRADAVKLIAEGRHLVRAVFVAGDHLIDGIDDYGGIAFFLGPSDQLRRQLVHGAAAPAQVPDVDCVRVPGRNAQGFVHVLEAVQAGGPVQFQVHVQHAAGRAG